MPRRRLGIRARVVASFLVLLALAEVASVVVLQEVGERRIDADVADDLAVAADDLRVRLESEPQLGRPDGPSLGEVFDAHLRARPVRGDEAYLVFVGGQPYAASAGSPVDLAALDAASAWAGMRDTGTGTLDTAAGPMAWVAVPVLAGEELLGVFVATQLVGGRYDVLRDTTATVALVTVLVLAAASLLAWSAAGRALRPVRELAAAARSVSTGDDLDARIEVRSSDEVGDLTASLNEMLDNLQVAFDSQKDFLDGAAHELKAPLTIVRGHVELLDDDPGSRATEVALVLDEIDRMDRLVEELRLLARAERPDFLELEPVEVAAFIEEVGQKASALAPRQWVVEPGAPGRVRADRQRLTQAVLNLVSNAVHVTGDGARIGIGATRRHDVVVIWVDDDGPGIAADDLPTLFQREGRTVARRPGGTGLGLPLVDAIARAHGGSVSASSEPGSGTRIEIVLPGGAG